MYHLPLNQVIQTIDIRREIHRERVGLLRYNPLSPDICRTDTNGSIHSLPTTTSFPRSWRSLPSMINFMMW
jgi:hypothetical protein